MAPFSHICLDLDGTTLALKSDITDFCSGVLAKLNKEIPVVLVSARIPSGMTYIQQKIGAENNPIVCYNGAYILQNNQVLHDCTIAFELVDQIYSICESLGIDLGIYSYNQWFAPSLSARVQKEINNTKTKPEFQDTSNTLSLLKSKTQGVHKLMLMGTKASADKAQVALEAIEPSFTAYRSNDTLIEIAPKDINKKDAIIKIVGSDLSKVIAFGDNYNDMEMIQEAGLGVAVANARESLKEIANDHALSCLEDGVAHFLNDYFKLGF